MGRVTFREADLSGELAALNKDVLSQRPGGVKLSAKESKAIQRMSSGSKECPGKRGIDFIRKVLYDRGIIYTTERQFLPDRKFKFDIAFERLIHTIPTKVIKIAVEYEGVFSEKSRHTSVTGYSRDSTKYNLAAINGWIVLRYTAMTYKNFEKELKMICP